MNVISERIVKTRKEHHCWGCKRLFPIGSHLEISTSVDGGSIQSSYWCEDCRKFLQTLSYWDTQDGFAYGDLLNYDEYKQKLKL